VRGGPRLPLRALFGPDAAESVTLSSDGAATAWVRPGRVRSRLVVRRGPARPRVVARLPGPVAGLAWWPTGTVLVAVVADRRAGRTRVLSVPVAGGRPRDVTPAGVGEVRLVDGEQPRRRSLLLAARDGTGRLRCHRMDRPDVPATPVPAPEGSTRWFTDAADRLCVAVGRDRDGALVVRAPASPGGPWREVWRAAPPAGLDVHPVDATASGDGLLLSAPGADGHLTPHVLDLAAARLRPLHPGGADLEMLPHPAGRTPLLGLTGGVRPGLRALDPAAAADVAALAAAVPGVVEPVGLSRDGAVWLLRAEADDRPPRYLRWDRAAGRTEDVCETRPALRRRPLARTAEVTVPTRDGLELDGLLTLPARAGRAGWGGLVLSVHGGPWSHDAWGFSAEDQWLADRGFGSLRVNFRGSEGYGTRFRSLADRDWGGRPQDDLEDAVRWAVRQGYADPARVAVRGRSYGGYAALAAATFRPRLFALAVAECAPSDLVAFLEHVAAGDHHERAHFLARVGDPAADRERLRARSPLTHAARCHTPVLLAHGRADPLVPVGQSLAFAAALRRHGHPHRCLLFASEGHGIAAPRNRVRLVRVVQHVLDQQLRPPSGGKPP
jgi:dipeptidyl aminopeptidase/acylaminoacyl peptidase